jgi:hypothetical protein
MTGDPYWANVVFLSGFEGGGIVDESPLAQTVTATGGAAISAVQAKYGTQSCLNSQTSKLTVPDHASFPGGTDAWTLEGWFRWTGTIRDGETHLMGQWDFGTASAMTLFYQHDWFGAADGALLFYIDSTGTGQGTGGDSRCEAAFTAVADTWYHIVGEFDGTDTYRIYVDGVCLDVDTTGGINFSASAQPFVIGNTDDTADGFVGYFDEVRFTAGVARYDSNIGFTPLSAAHERGAEDPLDVVVTEGVGLSGDSGMGDVFNETVTETIGTSHNIFTGHYIVAADDLGVSPLMTVIKALPGIATDTVGLAPAAAGLRAVLVAETMRMTATHIANQIVSLGVTSGVGIADPVTLGIPVALAETIGLDPLLQAQHSIIVAESLGLLPALLPNLIYGKSVEEVVGFADNLAQFFAGNIVETIGLDETMTGTGLLPGSVSETLGLAETYTSNLVLRVTAEEELGLEDTELLNLIYTGDISDGLELTAAYISPGGGFTTWAMNTRTGAVTEYSNYQFNSFAAMGSKYLGANENGLYELNGDDDDGEDIIAQIKSGFAQWAGARFTLFKGIYLGVRGEGDFVLRLTTGDGSTYNYGVSTRNMRSTKVHLGKGLRARYFAFELISTGQDFDLESIEFVPLIADRRV